MFRDTADDKRLGAWCFAAIVPTAIQLCGMPWEMTGVTCAICFGMALTVNRWGRYENRLFAALRMAALPVLLAQLLRFASESWPGDDRLVVPLAILVVAIWSAGKGYAAASRVGAVMFWVVLTLYLVIIASAAWQVRAEWLMPKWGGADWRQIGVLLIPVIAMPLAGEKRWRRDKLCLSAVYIAGAAAVTAGVLSPALASAPGMFYELSRSLSLFGVAQRLEAVTSAGMTLGWFSLSAILLSVGGQQAERVRNGWGRRGVVLSGIAAAVYLLSGVWIREAWLVGVIVALWGVIPLLECAISTRNGRKMASDLA